MAWNFTHNLLEPAQQSRYQLKNKKKKNKTVNNKIKYNSIISTT